MSETFHPAEENLAPIKARSEENDEQSSFTIKV
jgi:hypothetical protein